MPRYSALLASPGAQLGDRQVELLREYGGRPARELRGIAAGIDSPFHTKGSVPVDRSPSSIAQRNKSLRAENTREGREEELSRQCAQIEARINDVGRKVERRIQSLSVPTKETVQSTILESLHKLGITGEVLQRLQDLSRKH